MTSSAHTFFVLTLAGLVAPRSIYPERTRPLFSSSRSLPRLAPLITTFRYRPTELRHSVRPREWLYRRPHVPRVEATRPDACHGATQVREQRLREGARHGRPGEQSSSD